MATSTYLQARKTMVAAWHDWMDALLAEKPEEECNRLKETFTESYKISQDLRLKESCDNFAVREMESLSNLMEGT